MRQLRTTAVLVWIVALCGCAGSGGSQSGPEPTIEAPTTRTTTFQDSPSAGASGPPSSRPSTAAPTSSAPGSATESLLLARQVRIQEGGDGLGPTCRLEEDTPQAFRQEPGAWVNVLTSHGEHPGLTVLCLRGFSLSEPIDVDVVTGDYRAHTTVLPAVGPPALDTPLGYEEEPATTLFEDGAELRAYAVDYDSDLVDGPPGSLVTEMWQFLPPEEARETIAAVGSFTLTATQAGRSVTVRQPVARPSTRAYYSLRSPAPSGRLVLLGYPAGVDVPIGLYREGPSGTVQAELVKQVASVRIPASRVATYTVPAGLDSGLRPGWYCVLPPVSTPVDCERLTDWPDYPGPIMPGDRGAPVQEWQRILIEAGVMTDRPENRDGVYGPATRAAVETHLSNLGDPVLFDGALGSHVYAVLTGILVEP